jgi:ribosome-binding protein aMBF1 (putative translation factor)
MCRTACHKRPYHVRECRRATAAAIHVPPRSGGQRLDLLERTISRKPFPAASRQDQRSLQAGTLIDGQERLNPLASAKAKKIQELREARGYSVEDVAHRMGETPERVRALEASDEDPDEGVLSQYLDTLGMSQDEKRKVWGEEKHG